LPVGKGCNTKRRHAEPGRVDTMVADARGRAICFTSGVPSGLSTSLPPVLDQLREILGPGVSATIAFDHGGSYPALLAERDKFRERIGALHTDRAITIAALNRESTAAQRRIHTLDKQITELEERLKTVPAKLPANIIDPDAARAVHRTQRRALQMVLHLAGTITYTDTTIHIELNRPNTPRLTRALTLLPTRSTRPRPTSPATPGH
jgi:hypothetical protein